MIRTQRSQGFDSAFAAALGDIIPSDIGAEAEDSDLEAIAALSTTSYGRAVLALANQAALVALLPAYQPSDADLTAVAALTTTAYGRAFLALADQAALVALLPSYQLLSGKDAASGYPGLDSNSRIASSALPTDAIRLLYANTTIPAGNTVANTAVETAFASGFTLTGNTLRAGQALVLEMFGVYSTTVAVPGLTLKVKAGSVILMTTGLLAALAQVAAKAWYARISIVVQSIGASAALEVQAEVRLATTAGVTLNFTIPAVATIAVDSTGSLAFTATAQWDAADTGNTATLRQMTARG